MNHFDNGGTVGEYSVDPSKRRRAFQLGAAIGHCHGRAEYSGSGMTMSLPTRKPTSYTSCAVPTLAIGNWVDIIGGCVCYLLSVELSGDTAWMGPWHGLDHVWLAHGTMAAAYLGWSQ